MTQVAHYVLKRKLGAGAMGEVWLAEDSVLERDVAVKLIPADIAQDPERQRRFLREAKLAGKLNHPNTVTVHQAGIENDSIFVVMELVDGESLDKTVVSRGLLDWHEATRVICDATQGLAAAHELGLVHRDIKPANLMCTTKGVTKVVDFGLAREVFSNTQLTREGTLLGTPAFMAPEQWTGGEADARSDLYSLICTYYFLLTGLLPFDASSLPTLGYQHRYEPFPDPALLVPDLPPEISRFIARGSQKEPTERYQNAKELNADLESLLKAAIESRTSATGSNAHPMIVQKSLVAPLVASRQKSFWSKIPPRWRWIVAVGSGAAALLLLLGITLLISTPKGTVKIELDDPHAVVVVDGKKISIEKLAERIELRTGDHELIVRRGDVVVQTRHFTVIKGENPVLRITLLDNAVAKADGGRAESPTLPPSATPSSSPTPPPMPEPNSTSKPPVTLVPSDTTPMPDVTSTETTTPTPAEKKPLRIETNSMGMKLVLIPAGEFTMGSTDGDPNEQPPHQVKISQPFLMATTETTIGQILPWLNDVGQCNEYWIRLSSEDCPIKQSGRTFALKGGECPFGQSPDQPMICISWYAATAFADWLSKKENRTYRLPTEAEWEYAARAGSSSKWHFGDDERRLRDFAWFDDESDYGTHVVAQKQPNAWGLFDTSGNVSEWCQDKLDHDYYKRFAGKMAVDPQGPASTAQITSRTLRGGSWNYYVASTRSAYRLQQDESFRDDFVGFRLVCSPKTP